MYPVHPAYLCPTKGKGRWDAGKGVKEYGGCIKKVGCKERILRETREKFVIYVDNCHLMVPLAHHCPAACPPLTRHLPSRRVNLLRLIPAQAGLYFHIFPRETVLETLFILFHSFV